MRPISESVLSVAHDMGCIMERVQLPEKVGGKPAYNSLGRPIAPTEEGVTKFWRWFGNSVTKDDQGRPIVYYRGQHSTKTGAIRHRNPWLYFSPQAETASTYAKNPNDRRDQGSHHSPQMVAAYLRITKPFGDADDPFIEMADLEQIMGKKALYNLLQSNEDLQGALMNTNNWYEKSDEWGIEDVTEVTPDQVRELYGDGYLILPIPEVHAALKKAGYDGVSHGGNGESALEQEWAVANPKQALSVYSLKPLG